MEESVIETQQIVVHETPSLEIVDHQSSSLDIVDHETSSVDHNNVETLGWENNLELGISALEIDVGHVTHSEESNWEFVVNCGLFIVMLFLVLGIDYQDPNNIMDAVTKHIVSILALFFGFTFYMLIIVAETIIVDHPLPNSTWSRNKRVRYTLSFNICLVIINQACGFAIMKTYANQINPKFITWYTNFVGCGVVIFCIGALGTLIAIFGTPPYLLYKCYNKISHR